jgi:hypothetical protein
MKRIDERALAKVNGGELSGAALCGVAIGLSLFTGGWGVFAAVGFCFLANPTEVS